MSKWTSKLRNIALSKLVRVQRQLKDGDNFIDAISKTLSPAYFLRGSPQLGQAFQLAAVYHDLYMAAECDYYSDILSDWTPTVSYLMGSFTFTVDDVTGASHNYRVPLLICSSTEYSITTLDKGKVTRNSHAKAGCRGLFGGGVMTVLADSDAQEVKGTLVHEMIHAMVASLPELRDLMYGDTVAAQTEEIVTHFVTDHFSQLQTLYNMDLRVSSQNEEGEEKLGKTSCSKILTSTHQVSDIVFNGTSLVSKTINVDDKEAENLEAFVRQQIKEYNL